MEFVEFGGTRGIPVATVITLHYNGNLLWSLWSLGQEPNNSVYLTPLCCVS
jgi:hypothetical protein